MGSSVVEVRDERRGWLGDLLGRLLEDGGGRSEEGERIGLVEEVGDNLEEVDFDDDDVSVDFVSGATGSAGGLTLKMKAIISWMVDLITRQCPQS